MSTVVESSSSSGAAAAAAAAAAAFEGTDDVAEIPAPITKSRPKPKAKAKAATKAKTKTRPQKRVAQSESEQEAETDDTAKRARLSGKQEESASSNIKKRPTTRKPTSTASSAAAAAAAAGAAASSQTPKPVFETSTRTILGTHGKRVDDEVFEDMVPLLTKAGRVSPTDPDRSVVVVLSTRLQPVLSAWYNDKKTVNSTNIYTKLGTTREQVQNAKLVLFIVHGPFNERVVAGARMYGNKETVLKNNHWSLIAWSPSEKHAYHYDSMAPTNHDRCSEVLGTLRKYGVIPEDTVEFSTPQHFPQQLRGDDWSCGYYVLAAINIIARKPQITPIVEDDIMRYQAHFATISSGSSSAFRSYLRHLMLFNGNPFVSRHSSGKDSESESESDSDAE